MSKTKTIETPEAAELNDGPTLEQLEAATLQHMADLEAAEELRPTPFTLEHKVVMEHKQVYANETLRTHFIGYALNGLLINGASSNSAIDQAFKIANKIMARLQEPPATPTE